MVTNKRFSCKQPALHIGKVLNFSRRIFSAGFRIKGLKDVSPPQRGLQLFLVLQVIGYEKLAMFLEYGRSTGQSWEYHGFDQVQTPSLRFFVPAAWQTP